MIADTESEFDGPGGMTIGWVGLGLGFGDGASTGVDSSPFSLFSPPLLSPPLLKILVSQFP